MLEPEEYIQPGKPYEQICLGVLGKREDIKKDDLYEKILEPIVNTLGKHPDSIYLSNDGVSNIFIGDWAERNDIKSESIVADWRRLGRRAVALRDARIIKSATHLLIFEQPKSEYNTKIGLRELKKGKQIFCVTKGKDFEIEHWELQRNTQACLFLDA